MNTANILAQRAVANAGIEIKALRAELDRRVQEGLKSRPVYTAEDAGNIIALRADLKRAVSELFDARAERDAWNTSYHGANDERMKLRQALEKIVSVGASESDDALGVSKFDNAILIAREALAFSPSPRLPLP